MLEAQAGRIMRAYVAALPRGCEKATRWRSERVREDVLTALQRAPCFVCIQAVHLVGALGKPRGRAPAPLAPVKVAMQQKLFGAVADEPAVVRVPRQVPAPAPVGDDA